MEEAKNLIGKAAKNFGKFFLKKILPVILIVCIIIGVLAACAYYIFNWHSTKSNKPASTITQKATVSGIDGSSASMAYKDDNGVIVSASDTGISTNTFDTVTAVVNGNYDGNNETSVSVTAGADDAFVEYVHAMEGAEYNADGTKYVIADDGYGYPTAGYGVLISEERAEILRQAGYDPSLGSEVDIEFIDNIEKEEIAKDYENLSKIFEDEGVTLKSYQLNAIISRSYNTGPGSLISEGENAGAIGIRNGKNFVEAYKAYWNESDDKYGEMEGDENHQLYTQYMDKPVTSNGEYSEGLEKRRRSEWTLFQTGHYYVYNYISGYLDYEGGWDEGGSSKANKATTTNTSQTSSKTKKNDGSTFLDIVDEIHLYMEQNYYTYSQGEDWSENPGHLADTFEESKTGFHACDCALLVGWALHDFGYTEFIHDVGCWTIDEKMRALGAEEITDYDQLIAGDVCFRGMEHVQIYAGDGSWYNAGSTSSIQSRPETYVMDSFTHALRLPELGGKATGKKTTQKAVDKYADKTYAEKMRIAKMIDAETEKKAHEIVLGPNYTEDDLKNLLKGENKNKLIDTVNILVLNQVLYKYGYTEEEINGWDKKKKSQYIEVLEWGNTKKEIEAMTDAEFKDCLLVNGGANLYISTVIVWKADSAYRQYLKTPIQLERLISAELVTQYPKMDEEQITGLNGLIKLMRVGKSGGKKQLKQMEYNEFKEKVSAGDSSVLNYYTMDKKGNVTVATWKSVTTTTEGEYIEGPANADAPESSNSYTLSTTKVDYRTMAAPFTMPFNYLWTFLVMTEDIDFVMELADLVYDSDIQISLFDKVTTSTETTVRSTDKNTEITGEVSLNVKETATVDTGEAGDNGGILTKTVTNRDVSRSFGGNKQESFSQTTVIVTKTDTIEQHLTYANIWVAIYTHNYKYASNNGHTSGSEIPYDDVGPIETEFNSDSAPMEAINTADYFAGTYDSATVNGIYGIEKVTYTNTKNTVSTSTSSERIQEVAAEKAVYKTGTEDVFSSITGNVTDLKDVVFIGDSWMLNIEENDMFPGSAYAAEGGWSAANWLIDENYARISKEKSVAFVALGMNGADFYRSQMEQLIDRLSSDYREVYVARILHVAAGFYEGGVTADQYNSSMDAYNEAIKEKCSTMSNVYFVEVGEGLEENGYLSEYYADGTYHLKYIGYEKWAENITNAICSTSGGLASTTENMHWPSADSDYITSGFGPRNTGIVGASTYHLGIDIGAGYGTEAQAAEAGTVVESVEWSGSTAGNGARGNYITLDHGNGYKTRYQHLCEAPTLQVGQTVTRGQVVGYVGATGVGSGAHLHFEVLIDDTAVDPMNFKYDNGLGNGDSGITISKQETTNKVNTGGTSYQNMKKEKEERDKKAVEVAKKAAEEKKKAEEEKKKATELQTKMRDNLASILSKIGENVSERLKNAINNMTYNFNNNVSLIVTDVNTSYSVSITDAQEEVLQKLYSLEDFGIEPGLGERWAEFVILGHGGVYYSAADAAEECIIDTSRDNIPVGACVYGTRTENNPYGRVGIYMGNDLVAWGTEGFVNIDTVENFLNTYGSDYWGWGWLTPGNDLSQGEKHKVTIKVNQGEEPSEPGTDEPGTDEPGTNEPKPDEPGTNEPGTNEPKPDEPKQDEPKQDEPEKPDEPEPADNEITPLEKMKPSFAKSFLSHPKAHEFTIEISSWLFEALAANDDTANMVDLTKFIIYKATGRSYGITEFDFTAYFLSLSKTTNNGLGERKLAYAFEGCKFTKEEFVELVQSYTPAIANGEKTKVFRDRAAKIYDICKKNDVNPVVLAAQAYNESNWDESIIAQYNYWGITGNYKGNTNGKYRIYPTFEEGIQDYCDNITNRVKGNNGTATRYSQEFSKVNSKFAGSMKTLYDVMACWCEYGLAPGDWSGEAEKEAEYVELIVSKASDIFGEGALIVGAGNLSYVFYQSDYSYYAWGDSNGGTIAGCGCGPTSFAMVVSSLLNKNITPIETCEWCSSNGYYIDRSGTDGEKYFPAAANYYGINCQITTNISEVVSALQSGKLVIANPQGASKGGNNLFTNNGHFMVLYSIDSSGGIFVKNPNQWKEIETGRGDGPFSQDEISEANTWRNYYIFSK